MNITIIVLGLIGVTNLSLGSFIFLRNPTSKLNQTFFIMTSLITAWAIANFFTDYSTQIELNRIFNKLAYMFGFLAIVSAGVFTHYFTNQKNISLVQKVLLVLFVTFMFAFSGTNYISGNVEKSNGDLVFSIGSLIFLYYIAALAGVIFIIRNFIKFYKNGDIIQKSQARIIAISFGLSISSGMVSNIIIPAISADFKSAKYGPAILSVFLVGPISYAIVRHRLFDIRPIVARSFAYLLALLSIGLIYGSIVFGISHFFVTTKTTFTQQAFYLSFALITATFFQPIKNKFDKLTNNIFYRDAYDAQALLDELNSELVNNIDLNTLLGTSSKTISKYLKSDFCAFAIHQPNQHNHRVIGLKDEDWGIQQFKMIHKIIQPTRTRVLLTTEIIESHNEISKFMQEQMISAIIVLVAHKQEIGYLFLGEKKSGNIYSNQDKKIMEIIGEELAIAIQNALRFEEISRFNVTLQQKIDDATRKLRHANTRLKELDEAKDEFVSMASHQLRTPLTVIKGYLSMLLEGDMGKVTTKQKEIVQTAYDGAERMVFLIGDLLNVSRLQTGKFQIENVPSDLSSVIEHEVAHLQEAAANHQLKLVFEKPKTFPKLMLDEIKIRQVIMNFIDNAIYYTPAGGTITVKLEAQEKQISLTVSDTGLGVPKSEQHHLFSKFYRAGNARKMRPDGTGLGLYMAKKIVIAQGGAIIFTSEEGKGSTFGFSLPRHDSR